jgi:hypothetical protein
MTIDDLKEFMYNARALADAYNKGRAHWHVNIDLWKRALLTTLSFEPTDTINGQMNTSVAFDIGEKHGLVVAWLPGQQDPQVNVVEIRRMVEGKVTEPQAASGGSVSGTSISIDAGENAGPNYQQQALEIRDERIQRLSEDKAALEALIDSLLKHVLGHPFATLTYSEKVARLKATFTSLSNANLDATQLIDAIAKRLEHWDAYRK